MLYRFVALAGLASGWAANANPVGAAQTFRQYCFQCHGKAAVAGFNLEKLSSHSSLGDNFQQWEKVAAALEQKRMPPPKSAQPPDTERARTASWIRTGLEEFAARHAGDPGRVTVRRLTSGEYGYTIRDLTGLDLKFDGDFVSDSAGGEGFTNFGDVQFMQDADLERYLQAAKFVARHAVIGSGPLEFFADPGKSGLELSAIGRIQQIYRTHGFRAASGEGGKPYGLDRYGKALYAAWRYHHRAALGESGVTLEELGRREGLSPRFTRHIWSVLSEPSPTYPASEVVSRWKNLPGPKEAAKIRAGCNEIQKFLIEWPRVLFGAGAAAEGGQGDERALVLTDASVQGEAKHRLRFFQRSRGQKTARFYLTVVSMNPQSKDKPLVTWRNATVRFRKADRSAGEPKPLMTLLGEAEAQRLGFGRRPGGGEVDPFDFATLGDAALSFEVAAPADAGAVELQVDAQLTPELAGDAVLRCTISDRADLSQGRPVSVLLANPKSPGFLAWKANVLDFAAHFPQISHGEPTPSDKDPIPAPYDNTYNQPERDSFHTTLKYYRTDRFLVENMLDDATRTRLDQAWTDLLGSFEYHDIFLRFIGEKYKLNLKLGIGALSPAQLASLPREARGLIEPLRVEHAAIVKAMQAAQPGHVEDCIRFAGKAWRRPLALAEKTDLRSFYKTARAVSGQDHATAIRSLLARILIAPAFLYRLEQPSQSAGFAPLNGWEMASRLSYFLWSSLPDEELRRAAAAGELSNPRQLESQVKRMLADEKARRLATEFFGQWLGFYRFDQYRGVDTGRFPEFTDEIKTAMYDEAVSFFEHVIRKDRPVREILSADYTFLNKALARHYGVKKEIESATQTELVEGAGQFQRGGMLRLGAVLTATSAPLRTSPVKRGDWVLRRVLGTPTPPPPADAGSIPADDKFFGGLSLSEKLAAHQRNPSCASCHVRIDPLGFPLERYDAIGRWRDRYPDGKPVDDSSIAADKTHLAGVDGLLQYLKTQEQQVLRTLSQKLLGYALGRTVLVSDQPLIERLTKAGGDATFAALAAEIVTSRQFRYRREKDDSPPGSTPHSARNNFQRSLNGKGGR